MMHTSHSLFSLLVLFLVLISYDSHFVLSTSECLLRGFPFPSEELPTGNNPYGMVVIPKNVGSYHSGDLLISNWNNVNNTFFGQGNLITIIRNHQVIRTITIDRNQLGQCAVDQVVGTGLGFTMAMAYIGQDKIIQCSTPINFDVNNLEQTNSNGTIFPPQPGCCLIINSSGLVVASFRRNGINGPWGAASFVKAINSSTSEVTLFLSNVLGSYGTPLTQNNGVVTRYKFTLPDEDSDWVSGSDDTHVGTLGTATVIMAGFTSVPVNISGGAVGPGGLAYLSQQDHLIISDTIGGGSGKLLEVDDPLDCTHCTVKSFASCGENQCLNPIGINWAKTRDHNEFELLVANGGDGHLVQYHQDGTEVCFIIADAAGAGTLFNVISIPAGSGQSQVAYVDDGQNSAFFLSPYDQ